MNLRLPWLLEVCLVVRAVLLLGRDRTRTMVHGSSHLDTIQNTDDGQRSVGESSFQKRKPIS